MVTITRHKIDLDVESQLEFYNGLIFETGKEMLANDPLPDLGGLATDAIHYAGLLSLTKPYSHELANILRLAAYALNNQFLLAKVSEKAEPIEVFVPPFEPVMKTPSGVNDRTHAGAWLQAFYLATICREWHILDDLLEIDTELLRRSSTRTGNYAYHQVDMLKAFCKKEPTLPDLFIKALEATDPKIVPEQFLDYALNVAVHEINLIPGVIKKDTRDFNDSLIKALESHKKYASAKSRANDSRLFLSLGALAMATLAYIQGINLEVASDYIPKSVIEQKYRD
ncbi:MAG: immunity 49 family protein [Blastocatellia bacterium]|nr:immunity 49 family protein [Blastocatellia bacterium]